MGLSTCTSDCLIVPQVQLPQTAEAGCRVDAPFVDAPSTEVEELQVTCQRGQPLEDVNVVGGHPLEAQFLQVSQRRQGSQVSPDDLVKEDKGAKSDLTTCPPRTETAGALLIVEVGTHKCRKH